MKFIVYLLTLLFVGTAIAQNPTILQGNYITNVFGNSNFVLNPNALTNVANVAVSNATVTRSTTTPLVATSEFLVTVTSANGTIAWNTRTFDGGMKGQNCEARFTYRGFQSTSVAQVRQGATVAGANVVARLALTASTDPRIASINFPCGDLSQPTYFVITDTATLSGTHEIGGIYVGLATNMANVAQAEFVGGYVATSQSVNPTTASGSLSNFSGGNFAATLLEKATSYDAASASVTFSNLPAGNYQVIANGLIYPSNAGGSCRTAIKEDTSGDVRGQGFATYSTVQVNNASPFVASFSFSSSATRTFRLQAFLAGGTGNCTLELTAAGGIRSGITVYRFPSSSELVVTPERQNVWGNATITGSSFGGSAFSGSAASVTYATITSASIPSRRTLHGVCQAPTTSTNDVGCSIPNMPAGKYEVSFSGFIFSVPGNAGAQVNCASEIFETTSSNQIAVNTNGTQMYTGGARDYYPRSLSGVFNNTSVATRNFVIRWAKTVDSSTSNLGTCNGEFGVTGTGTPSSWSVTVTPLDQPSNSALYVEGPVKAAATGAAIPAGYVGEQISATLTDVATSTTTTTTSYNAGSISLTNGIWMVFGKCAWTYGGGGPTWTSFTASLSTTSATLHGPSSNIDFTTGQPKELVSGTRILNVTSGPQTVYLVCTVNYTAAGITNPRLNAANEYLYAIRLN